mmetsp:Transcript_14418/g.40512  ORF Transcript_14418/g.40512 Transcript_14418/m.40512 type:complete len:136 (+) Transcript_14418:50-457(+)
MNALMHVLAFRHTVTNGILSLSNEQLSGINLSPPSSRSRCRGGPPIDTFMLTPMGKKIAICNVQNHTQAGGGGGGGGRGSKGLAQLHRKRLRCLLTQLFLKSIDLIVSERAVHGAIGDTIAMGGAALLRVGERVN